MMNNELLPIREISRITGVNSVTLRAWERRYGLIKPQRTDKGHRLYRREDVELIIQIQAWLSKGLAISKVSELLAANSVREEPHFSLEEDIWKGFISSLMGILAELHIGRFNAFFNTILADYPPALVADKLITPVLQVLQQPNFGNHAKLAFFQLRLEEYLAILIIRQRQNIKGQPWLCIELAESNNRVKSCFLRYAAAMGQMPFEYLGCLPVAEVIFAYEKLNAQGILVYAVSCRSLVEFQRDLQLLIQKTNKKLVIAGDLVSALSMCFPESAVLVASDSQTELFSVLKSLSVGESLSQEQ